MKVIKADVLGFCMGVCRAVDTVQKIVDKKQIDSDSNTKIYTMGPLIHNPGVLKKMEDQGVEILKESEIEKIPENSVVVIRAHGVPPVVYERLKKRNAVIEDATCPRVKVSQKRAAEFSAKGYKVILAGDKGHGEVLGIAGFAGENFLLVQNREEVDELVLKNIDKNDTNVILLSQTTFSPSEFKAISEKLQKLIPNIQIFNTICSATQERQDALVRLCEKVDGVIVIGGKNSANTQRLFVKAKQLCKAVALIETPAEIPNEFYLLDTVGITAGASTPAEVIESVEKRLLG